MPPRNRQAPETPEKASPERAATVTRGGLVPVRFLVAVAGLDFSRTPGEVVELPADEAAKWCDGVRAERTD